jgi:transposase
MLGRCWSAGIVSRAAPSSWPFRRLDRYIAYKAERAGVPVIWVDAAYTSQMCPRCGHTARSNRPDRDTFSCRRCGLSPSYRWEVPPGPADVVAGVNVRNRARSLLQGREVDVANILGKLGAGSRGEAAALAHSAGLVPVRPIRAVSGG